MRRPLLLLVRFVTGVLLAVVAPVALAQGQEPRAAAAALLNPGDILKITVWRNPELSGEFPIDPDSTLRHPLYRSVRPGGRTVAAATEMVRQVLLRYETDPQFVVEPRFRVMVSGMVRTPSLYTFGPEITIAEAVIQAGGVSEVGSSRARLTRAGKRHAVRLDRPTVGLAAQPIHSGDLIEVERRRGGMLSSIVVPVISLVGALGSVILLVRR